MDGIDAHLDMAVFEVLCCNEVVVEDTQAFAPAYIACPAAFVPYRQVEDKPEYSDHSFESGEGSLKAQAVACNFVLSFEIQIVAPWSTIPLGIEEQAHTAVVQGAQRATWQR